MKFDHEKPSVDHECFLRIHDGKIEAKRQHLPGGGLCRVKFSEPVEDVGLSEWLIIQKVDFFYGGYVFDGSYVYLMNHSNVHVYLEDDDVFVKLPDIEDEPQEDERPSLFGGKGKKDK